MGESLHWYREDHSVYECFYIYKPITYECAHIDTEERFIDRDRADMGEHQSIEESTYIDQRSIDTGDH